MPSVKKVPKPQLANMRTWAETLKLQCSKPGQTVEWTKVRGTIERLAQECERGEHHFGEDAALQRALPSSPEVATKEGDE